MLYQMIEVAQLKSEVVVMEAESEHLKGEHRLHGVKPVAYKASC